MIHRVKGNKEPWAEEQDTRFQAAPLPVCPASVENGALGFGLRCGCVCRGGGDGDMGREVVSRVAAGTDAGEHCSRGARGGSDAFPSVTARAMSVGWGLHLCPKAMFPESHPQSCFCLMQSIAWLLCVPTTDPHPRRWAP